MTEIKTVNLKADRPTVHEALQRLEREIAVARRENHTLLKIVHGYGSTGVGGDIRIAVQKRLQELATAGEIRGCIFGEDFRTGLAITAIAAGIEKRRRSRAQELGNHDCRAVEPGADLGPSLVGPDC